MTQVITLWIWMEEVQMPKADEYKEYVSYEMLKDQKVIASGT